MLTNDNSNTPGVVDTPGGSPGSASGSPSDTPSGRQSSVQADHSQSGRSSSGEAARCTSGRVYIFDTTLRDGEQSAGISLNTQEKLEIARALERLGVDVIEAGFPVASDGDFQAVRAISESVRDVTVCALSRTTRRDIDQTALALEPAQQSRIHLFLASSDIHLTHKLRMTRDEMLAEAVSAVEYAREHFDEVQFSPEDASRTQEDFLVEVLCAVADAGARVLNIPDTVGYSVPTEWRARIERVVSRVTQRVSDEVCFSVHCHDDLGLAVANTLAGIEVGVRQAEVCVNGIGERAGNAALEEVVMALTARRDHFGDIAPRVDTRLFREVSQLVAQLTGYGVPANKAVVGRNAFAHESGIHQHGVLRDRSTYEILDPASVGAASELVLGKHSGRAALSHRANELGYQLSAGALDDTLKALKALSDRQGRVSDDELIELLSATRGAAADR